MKSFKKMNIKFDQGRIICDIVLNDESKNNLFAFYVFRGDERIHVSWYSSNSSFSFDTAGIPGYYRVMGFVKNNLGHIETKKSDPLFLNPIVFSPGDFLPDDKKCFTLQLKGKRWNFPALYFPNAKKTLFVLMPSAVDRGKMVLPVFSRWTWASDGLFPGNVLCIADPTLELNADLGLGWLLGTKENYAIIELAEFVKRIAQQKNIPNERIVFYGSSAGGFAALAMASVVNGATAVAINAQTDVLSYHVLKQVSLVQKYCFDNLSRNEIRNHFLDRVDMAVRWNDLDNSKVFLIQNETDIHHYNDHFLPFWRSLGGNPASGFSTVRQHIAWVYVQEGGHIPESKEMANTIISLLNKTDSPPALPR